MRAAAARGQRAQNVPKTDMATNPIKFRCPCAGDSVWSWVADIWMPQAMPIRARIAPVAKKRDGMRVMLGLRQTDIPQVDCRLTSRLPDSAS